MTVAAAVNLMVYGFIVAEEVLIAWYFARFWRSSRVPMFGFFTAAFIVMAVHRISLGIAVGAGLSLDQQAPMYLVRFAAYLLIFIGIVVNNMRRAR